MPFWSKEGEHAWFEVLGNIQKIAADPNILLGNSAVYDSGILDGKHWDSADAFAAVKALAPELPHLLPVLVAFFKGAAETWKRFISEFAPGGLIDEATPFERDLARLPPTNDVNEGALGSFRILMRQQPQLSQLQYNAQAMYFYNETEAFMKEKFHPEDYKFIRRMARELESQGLEVKRKKDLVQHMKAKNEKKKSFAGDEKAECS